MNGMTFDSFAQNFLGRAPVWYKQTILAFLVINPILLMLVGPYITGWVLVLEFIFTLAMALQCYPLQPGGLLAIEGLILGMTSPNTVYHEVEAAFSVILLLVFMVAGIYFMKELLLFTFTKILLSIRSKMLISFLFCIIAAVLSAFLDALTVTAVVISVAVGFYTVFYRVASGSESGPVTHDDNDADILESERADLEQFRAFLRNLLMHAAVGTALGGVCTTVGEPQNLLIATYTEWSFIEFFLRMAPVTMPVLVVGLTTCLLLEQFKISGYGVQLPERVRTILVEFDNAESAKRTDREKARLVVQAVSALILVFALALHVA